VSVTNKHNSIVFLTTLCLGLIFVGATPQVLTFAALTRNFDVQNEVEVKDDLDNKPDGEEVESFAKDDFPALFAQLLVEIKKEVEDGKISLPLQADFYVDGEFHKSEFSEGGGAGGGGIGSTVSNQNLSLLIQNAVNQKFQPKAFELADYDNQKSKIVKIRIEASDKDLSLKLSFGKSKAEQFAEFLNQDFSSSAALIKDALTKEIYENTKATSENNQVFIVTRLPRGSLDELLKNAKAESK
jgi:hypothetical protein